MLSYLRQGRLSLFRHYNSSNNNGLDKYFKKIREAEARAKKNMPVWEKRDESLRKRYGKWNPTHKLSRQQMMDIRELKKNAPDVRTIQFADHFNVNPDSIRRILKSKWVPSEKELIRISERAEKRKKQSAERKEASAAKYKLGLKFGGGVGRHGSQNRKPWHKKDIYGIDQDKKSKKRSFKPYTETVGDFIE